jgi:hypothetical protein
MAMAHPLLDRQPNFICNLKKIIGAPEKLVLTLLSSFCFGLGHGTNWDWIK